MFVLLFAYVFGSAIPVDGLNYREFLMAGIFAQTVVFGSTITGASLAEDLQKGIIDRFRSLPMSRSAVLVGRTAADLANNLIVLIVMSLTGLVVGWRIHTSVLEALAAYALLLRLRAAAALRLRDVVGDGGGRAARPHPRGREQRELHRDLPADVHREHVRPDEQLPDRAQGDRRLEPHLVDRRGGPGAVRQRGAERPAATAWPLQHPVLYVLIWVVAILAVFVPLAVAQFKRAASR
jgi:ABC-type Na+ efflux pump permease subunit